MKLLHRIRQIPIGLKPLETALYIGLFAAILCGAAKAGNTPLEDKLVRLHVVAASDSEEDQALKLRVRDEALTYLQTPLASAASVEEAMGIIGEALPELERHLQDFVQAEGSSQRVRASLGESEFPTRHYESFSLPAGPYTALRIVLDEGQGQNWWCVVFPPLCTAAALENMDSFEALGLSGEDVALITMDDERYVVKFKLLEWWGKLRNLVRK